MKKPIRYNIVKDNQDTETGFTMRENVEGAWVSWDDYRALAEAHLAATEPAEREDEDEQRRRTEEAFEDLIKPWKEWKDAGHIEGGFLYRYTHFSKKEAEEDGLLVVTRVFEMKGEEDIHPTYIAVKVVEGRLPQYFTKQHDGAITELSRDIAQHALGRSVLARCENTPHLDTRKL